MVARLLGKWLWGKQAELEELPAKEAALADAVNNL